MLFNQPDDFIVHDFSAYEDKGIIQIIESYPDSMVDYCLKYFDDNKLAQIKHLSLYYESEEDLEAAIAQKFANNYSPLVFEN